LLTDVYKYPIFVVVYVERINILELDILRIVGFEVLTAMVMKSDSKLLSGFPWHIIFKPELIKKTCLQNMKV
jgi:hypothetical protein